MAEIPNFVALVIKRLIGQITHSHNHTSIPEQRKVG